MLQNNLKEFVKIMLLNLKKFAQIMKNYVIESQETCLNYEKIC